MARHRITELRRRVYLVLEQGPVGDRLGVLVDRLLVALILVNLVAVALESVPEYRRALCARLRSDRIFLARRVHGRIRPAAVGRGRAWPAPASRRHARAAQICAQPRRHRRSCRRAAVLVRARAARRSPLRAGVPHRALLQDRALFAGHALAARRALPRAPRAVRLPGDHHGQRAGRRRPDASRRGQGAAGQARHHSRRAVVVDRDRRHHRLWRRGADHRARQADRHRHHLPRPDHDGAADRHHRHRLRRADPSPRFHRHLGHDRARAAVRRARCRRRSPTSWSCCARKWWRPAR